MARIKYITAEEFGARLGIDVQNVTRMCREGRIKGAREPRGWLIPHDAPDPRLPHGRPRKSDPVRRRPYHDEPVLPIEPIVSNPDPVEPESAPVDPLAAMRQRFNKDETI